MKTIERWKIWTFIGILFVVALFINGAYDHLNRQEQPRIPSPNYRPEPAVSQLVAIRPPEPQPVVQHVREKTPEELAAEHASFLARYMNERPSRSPGVELVAIVVVNEGGKLNSTLAKVFADHSKGNGVKLFTSLFTPEFVSEGFFEDAFSDSPNTISTLDLHEVLDSLLLARQTVEYSTNTALENVLTATMQLEVRWSSITHRGESQAWTFTATGAGFRPTDARKAAEERILKQLSSDTNIVIPTSQ